jgi:hypothetical protein
MVEFNWSSLKVFLLTPHNNLFFLFSNTMIYMSIYILNSLIKQHQIQNLISHWFYTEGGRKSRLIFGTNLTDVVITSTIRNQFN